MRYPLIDILKEIGFILKNKNNCNALRILDDWLGHIENVHINYVEDTIVRCDELKFTIAGEAYHAWCDDGKLYVELCDLDKFREGDYSFCFSSTECGEEFDAIRMSESGELVRFHYASLGWSYYCQYDEEAAKYIRSLARGIYNGKKFTYGAEHLSWERIKKEVLISCLPIGFFPVPDFQARFENSDSQFRYNIKIYEQFFEMPEGVCRDIVHSPKDDVRQFIHYELFHQALIRYLELTEERVSEKAKQKYFS